MSSLRAVLFLTIYFTSTHALQCYDCIFYDGYNNSDHRCQKAPNVAMLKTCDEFQPRLGGEISVCKTVTGVLDGKPAVVRGCAVSFSDLAGTCGTAFNVDIGKSFTKNAYGCICSEDRCNGATEIRFNWASLFAIAVCHTLYRFIAVRDQ